MLDIFIKLSFLLLFLSGQFFIIQDFVKGRNPARSVIVGTWIFLAINIPIIFNSYLIFKAEQPIPVITPGIILLQLGICLCGIIGLYRCLRKRR